MSEAVQITAVIPGLSPSHPGHESYLRKDEVIAFRQLIIIWCRVKPMVQLFPLPNVTEDGTEKRRWPRYHIDVPVKAMVRCEGTPKMVHGMANNLSLGGMAALLPVELAIGEWLEVLVTLPFCSQPVKVRTVVRNRRNYVYGLEFVNITASPQAGIERACYSLAMVQ